MPRKKKFEAPLLDPWPLERLTLPSEDANRDFDKAAAEVARDALIPESTPMEAY